MDSSSNAPSSSPIRMFCYTIRRQTICWGLFLLGLTRCCTLNSHSDLFSFPDFHSFQDLEAEINCYWTEFFTETNGTECPENSESTTNVRNILSCQLVRCAVCLQALSSGDSVMLEPSRTVRRVICFAVLISYFVHLCR